MNTALRTAMEDRHVRPGQLAAQLGVSVDSVKRWLRDAGTAPHPGTRAQVAEYLGVSDEMLWPAAAKTVVKTGADREVVSVYPYRSACPKGVWAELVERAKDQILFAGFTNYFIFLEQPAFHRTLEAKLQQGVRIRFLLGDPEGSVTRAREQIEDVALSVSMRIRITEENLAKVGARDGLEVRYSSPEDATNHVGLSVFRFDEDALVCPHLARLVGHDSPMMHLRRRDDHGMFDRFAEHAEELWDRGRPTN
ncbi:XRE family transcriptional regulator [Streptomyces sp. NPDC001843]|uniref:XRE family transcriptional regulator n=1 Tax=Streptomyces sp. NPDC001843 TaxID=3364617 RepID=UPI00367B7036